MKSSMKIKPTTSQSPDHHKSVKPDDHGKEITAKRAETHLDADRHDSKPEDDKGERAKPEITEAERSRVKKQHTAELQQKQVLSNNQNKEVLDVLTEEQKRDRERAKQLEKVSDPVEREKLELKFDTERAKIKQKMKNMVKRHAEEISKLENAM